MRHAELQALGTALLDTVSLPADTEISALAEQDPDVLRFVARISGPMPRAGSVGVSHIAVEDHGPGAAESALARLVQLLEDESLPSWPTTLKAPSFGVLVSGDTGPRWVSES